MLISKCNANLVIARETIHKGKKLTPNTFINVLVNKRSGVVVLRVGSIDIIVINSNPNGPLLLIDMNNI